MAGDRVHDLVISREPVSALWTYHSNPRRGDVEAIGRSLVALGQYRPIVVNRGTLTGRPSEVLAGNHTLMAARAEGWSDVAVCWVDVDDDQAARIVAADNRTSDLGDYDMSALAELLGELPDLDGTGYANRDLAAMVGVLEAPADVHELVAKYGEPDDTAFHPEIRIKVAPDLFDRWRTALDRYQGRDDVSKLDGLLSAVEVMHG